ncbi:MAG: nucleotidyltransferase substrate binding protein [Bacteroidia bacterium]|nr:nucleotidyltransferase substrate binding protein [Bacteroidia bacterium]MDW8158878.1 nucleotidyltransferase substrate binding protein [Bacteroidia bacterium]
MINAEVRWKQRFQNYEKALGQLKRFLQNEVLNELETQGLIKCFEYTYELAWNTMKDFLYYQGITNIAGSRDAIRQAFHYGLISNGEMWMQMVEDRILTVHTYNENMARSVEIRIRDKYFFLFEQFSQKMKLYL